MAELEAPVAMETTAERDLSKSELKAQTELTRLVRTADLYPPEGEVDQPEVV
jgi:hypothetical protein